MSCLLKCSMKQEIAPCPFSPYTPCTSLAFCLQCASLSGQTPTHPATPSSNVTVFERIPCVPEVSYIYILPLFLHIIILLSLFIAVCLFGELCLPKRVGALLSSLFHLQPLPQCLPQSFSTVNG